MKSWKSTRCMNCRTIFEYRPCAQRGKFCKLECQAKWKRKRTTKKAIALLKAGKANRRVAKRALLALVKKRRCSICKKRRWQGKPIPLWIDHIDGRSNNRKKSNYRLVCLNCDAQQPTFGGRNIGNGRKSLGVSVND